MEESMVVKIKFRKRSISAFFTLSIVLAMIVCLICDYFITKELSWSLIVVISLITSWLLFASLLTKEVTIRNFLIMLSIVIIPYLALLSILLKLPIVFSLGTSIAAVSCIGLWSVYGVFLKFHKSKLFAFGVTFLIVIPITLGITHIVAYFITGITTNSSSDMFNVFITLLLALVCFGGHYFFKYSNN